jgi:hypothetical protein
VAVTGVNVGLGATVLVARINGVLVNLIPLCRESMNDGRVELAVGDTVAVTVGVLLVVTDGLMVCVAEAITACIAVEVAWNVALAAKVGLGVLLADVNSAPTTGRLLNWRVTQAPVPQRIVNRMSGTIQRIGRRERRSSVSGGSTVSPSYWSG